MDNQESGELKRAIGLPYATAMVVGTIIGAAIFIQPAEITSQIPSIPGVLLAWFICGILTLFGALVCAELASIYTKSGGVYVYLKEAFSPALGFLWGWAMFWVVHSGIIAVLAVGCARYVDIFAPMGDGAQKATAVAIIVVLSAINYVGVKHGSMLQAFFTYAKLLAIALIIVLGIILGAKLPEHYIPSAAADASVSISEFALALIAGLFAFGGWHMVTYNAEETINPKKTIPRALVLGTVIITVCYFAMNAVYFYILPFDTVAASERVAADAADKVIGAAGAKAISGLVIFSIVGALSGIILTGPRVYFSMARDGLLFQWAAKIHPTFRTPHRAIVLQAVWSAILVFTGSYRDLFTRVIYTEWIFFGLMAIGLFILRRRKNIERGYSMWGYPFTPAIFISASFFIVVNYTVVKFRDNALESVLGLLIVLAGLPIYYLWMKFNKNKERS
jgi:APA family basic amino acid/polyamine antiporter